MNAKYSESGGGDGVTTSDTIQFSEDEDFNYLIEQATPGPKQELISDIYNTNIISNNNNNNNLDEFYALNEETANNIDGSQVILDGETQIRFLGNIRVWQLAATFLFACVILSKNRKNTFFKLDLKIFV